MEYFCYISESKLDQLYPDDKSNSLEMSPEVEIQQERVKSLNKQLITYQVNRNRLEEKKASYGTLDVPIQVLNEFDQTEAEIDRINQELALLGVIGNIDRGSKFGFRLPADQGYFKADPSTLVKRLRVVLNHIYSQETVGDINKIIANNGKLNAFCYLVSSRFRVEGKEMDIFTLSSVIGKYTLKITCSMKYFSEISLRPDGKGGFNVIPNSFTKGFFSGSVSIHFRGLIFVLDKVQNDIIGSPLYLMLESTTGLDL